MSRLVEGQQNLLKTMVTMNVCRTATLDFCNFRTLFADIHRPTCGYWQDIPNKVAAECIIAIIVLCLIVFRNKN